MAVQQPEEMPPQDSCYRRMLLKELYYKLIKSLRDILVRVMMENVHQLAATMQETQVSQLIMEPTILTMQATLGPRVKLKIVCSYSTMIQIQILKTEL